MTDDESKRIILSRRARFVAAALASAGLAANPACGGRTDDGSDNGGGAGSGGSGGQAHDASRDRNDEPQVCLEPPGGFGGVGGMPLDAPSPCLTIAIDAQADATPQPCLTQRPPETDAGADADAEPQPCLVPPG